MEVKKEAFRKSTAARWLNGQEYYSLLKGKDLYSEQLNIPVYEEEHPEDIYFKPQNGQFYYLVCSDVDRLGFPKLAGSMKKSILWKRLNFKTDLPKQRPLVSYIVASSYTKNSTDQYRMHIVWRKLEEELNSSKKLVLCHLLKFQDELAEELSLGRSTSVGWEHTEESDQALLEAGRAILAQRKGLSTKQPGLPPKPPVLLEQPDKENTTPRFGPVTPEFTEKRDLKAVQLQKRGFGADLTRNAQVNSKAKEPVSFEDRRPEVLGRREERSEEAKEEEKIEEFDECVPSKLLITELSSKGQNLPRQFSLRNPTGMIRISTNHDRTKEENSQRTFAKLTVDNSFKFDQNRYSEWLFEQLYSKKFN